MTRTTAIALATVYVVWGSTYLAIRVMVETIPPLVGAGVRFLLAGLLLGALLVARRGSSGLRASSSEVASAAAVATLVLVGGIGLVTVAEQHVASGIAALSIASVPLWVLLLRIAARERVGPAAVGAVVLGFGGVVLLLAPGSREEASVAWLALAVVAAVVTALGAWCAPRWPLPSDAYLAATIQLVSAGLLTSGLGLAFGELPRALHGEASARSIVAFAYLVVFGSLIAYSAFTWLLQNAPSGLVATYAYVNPVIALFLGVVLLGERLSARLALSALIIVASVVLATRTEVRGKRVWASRSSGAPTKQ